MKLPSKIFGIDTSEAYKRYLDGSISKKEPEQSHNKPLTINPNINGNEYIRVPGTNSLIAKQETHKGLNWNDTHFALADNGLYMPTIELFMKYFMSLKDASESKITLYDGNNIPIPKDEATDSFKYMTSGYKDGCWTWLDVYFTNVPGQSNLILETDHRVIIDKNGAKKLIGRKNNLESCLIEDCFSDLEFNSQGLPIKKSKDQKYQKGSNIYFYKPRADRVAGFWARGIRTRRTRLIKR